jgi:ABC-type multidrug transport system permease subunit
MWRAGRPSTFVLAKLIAEIPALAVAAASYGFMLYWTVGLTPGWETFLFFILVFFAQMVRHSERETQ